jgi:hypothetical protein
MNTSAEGGRAKAGIASAAVRGSPEFRAMVGPEFARRGRVAEFAVEW